MRASIAPIYIHVEDASTTVLVHKPLALDEHEYPTLEVRAKDGTPLASLFFRSVADLHARALEIAKATETVANVEASPELHSEAGEPAAFDSAVAGESVGLASDPAGVVPAAGETSAVPCGNHPCVRSSGHTGDCLAAPDDDGDEWTPGGNQRFGL